MLTASLSLRSDKTRLGSGGTNKAIDVGTTLYRKTLQYQQCRTASRDHAIKSTKHSLIRTWNVECPSRRRVYSEPQ